MLINLAQAAPITPADLEVVEQRQKALLEQAQQQRDDLQNTTDLPTLPLPVPDRENHACHDVKHVVF
ncbi:hypothetical protein [Serratia ureilytica]|uniref:hypothetical protein n=1 Tax=Serratia ureilytica TaxID=300181 RepID=UPI00313EDA31